MKAKLFKILKDNLPELTIGSEVMIYPNHVPDNKLPGKAITYTVINQSMTLNMVMASVQINCIAKTALETEELAQKIYNIFKDKRLNGGFIDTDCTDIFDIGYDKDSGLYMSAVSLRCKYQNNVI
jgi:hypothetical protein